MKDKILIILFTAFFSSLFAQISTFSPYSSQGYGDASFYGDAYFSGLGGITSTTVDSTQFNMFNPSSYSFISQGLPLVAFGLAHNEFSMRQNDDRFDTRLTSITQMGLGVPFGNRFGLGFGLKPFSRVGYEINSYELVNNDSVFYDYSGKGELQEFNVGFSILIAKTLNHQLSIGANGKRYFGSIENERQAYTKSNFTQSGRFERNFLKVGDYGYDLGLTYKYSPSSRHVLTIGGIYRPAKQVGSRQSEARVDYEDFGNIASYDTSLAVVERAGTMTIPEKIVAGISYEFKAVRDSVSSSGRQSSVIISTEFAREGWEDYYADFGSGQINPNFMSTTSIRAGLQYTPHRYPGDRSSYNKLIHRVSYRFGAFLSQEPYVVGGTQLEHRGASFGLGVPLVMNRAVSTLNLSVTYGQRGENLNEQFLRENYIGINFGITISPSYDRWFTKYELD